MLLSELVMPWGIKIRQDVEIKAISSDSRQLKTHSLWLAMQGIQHHALTYTPPVTPAAILYEPPYPNPPAEALPLPELSALAGHIASRFYGEPSQQLQVVGITGTDGKSSLVHLLAQALDAAMLGTIGYGRLSALENSSHTTPEALQVQRYLADFLQAGIKTVAMEVSSHALHQHRVAGVQFAVAIFSNLSHEHLDYHLDMEDYFYTKARIFQQANSAVINVDDAYGQRLLTEGLVPCAKTVTVSAAGETKRLQTAHFSAHELQFLAQGLRFRLRFDDGQTVREAVIQSALLARFNLANLLNVAASLWLLGHDFDWICQRLSALKAVTGRAEALPLRSGAQAIIDYAHTPAALENILQGIRPHVRGRLYCIFGCGGDRDRSKRPKMGQAAKRFADVVVLTDDNPRTENPEAILREIDLAEAHSIRPRAQAIEWVLQQLQADDAVVIAGKGHERYQIIGTERHDYADHDVVRAWEQSS